MTGNGAMTARRARKLLGVRAGASPADLRAAWRQAAKTAHPDQGGDPTRFREVIEAYRFLREDPSPLPLDFPPAAIEPAPQPCTLTITPAVAAAGGHAEALLPDGRRLKLGLTAGLRQGDTVRAGGEVLTIVIRGEDGTLVRGDDLWMTARLDPRLLAEGGRLEVATPQGRRIVWISRKDGERGLVRLPGQGLPAMGAHGQGDLFLRLEGGETPVSPARAQLRRFAAVWAA